MVELQQASLSELHVTKSSKPTLAVFGLGYVGLPLALSYAASGCHVFGIDINTNLVGKLKSGVSHLVEAFEGRPISAILAEQLQNGRFEVHSSAALAMRHATEVIITVGMPVANGRPLTEPLEQVCRDIAQHLRPGQLVLVRSTVVPGTTRDLVLPILESSGLRAGRDFYLAYAPERIAEGNAFHEHQTMPAVVSGLDEESRLRAVRTLRLIVQADIHGASNLEAAEACKVVENIQRDVNIALAQEIARFAQGAGLDAQELIRLANTHTRVKLLTPGAGVGGFCIPNAYYYLAEKSRSVQGELPLMMLSRSINDDVPARLVDRVCEAVEKTGRSVTGAKAAVFGLAMKNFSSDDRLSPANVICEQLKAKGFRVSAYDPLVPRSRAFQVDTPEECVAGASALLLLVEQQGFRQYDYLGLLRLANPRAVVLDVPRLVQPGVLSIENTLLTI